MSDSPRVYQALWHKPPTHATQYAYILAYTAEDALTALRLEFSHFSGPPCRIARILPWDGDMPNPLYLREMGGVVLHGSADGPVPQGPGASA